MHALFFAIDLSHLKFTAFSMTFACEKIFLYRFQFFHRLYSTCIKTAIITNKCVPLRYVLHGFQGCGFVDLNGCVSSQICINCALHALSFIAI